jgi:hypothetical protein
MTLVGYGLSFTFSNSYALTRPLQYVTLLKAYGGSSSNDTVFSTCLLIYLSVLQRLNLFS